jgi:hypothetical protein
MEKMETRRHGEIKRKTENGSPGNFPYSVECLLIVVQTEVVICLFVDEETNGGYLFCKQTK